MRGINCSTSKIRAPRLTGLQLMNFDQWSVVAPTPTYKPIERTLDLIDDDADAAEIRSICCCDRTRCCARKHRRSVTTPAALGLLTFGACRGPWM